VLHISRECVRKHRYLNCVTHAPYCDQWTVRFCSIFLHHIIKDMIFGVKKIVVENKKGVLILSTRFSDKYLILTRLERNII
jgi:hypothetical protein